jgi:hypothetical protein
MKKTFFILCVFGLMNLQMADSNAMVWGKTGHRVTGEIAQNHLTSKAKREINKLLNGNSLAVVSTYADEIKSDRAYKEFSAWHYINFSLDKNYGEEPLSKYGDLVTGINKCIAIIKDDKASDKDKTFYLKMLVHFIGDLHQPMHCGRPEDRGGNDIQLQWFNEGTNLHRVWDTNMLNSYGMTYTELASNLDILSRKENKQIQEGSVIDWVNEVHALTKNIYGSVEVGEKLMYRYSYDHLDTAKHQLLKGGLRLAKVLNDTFK